jgi:hypothetical protein
MRRSSGSSFRRTVSIRSAQAHTWPPKEVEAKG